MRPVTRNIQFYCSGLIQDDVQAANWSSDSKAYLTPYTVSKPLRSLIILW